MNYYTVYELARLVPVEFKHPETQKPLGVSFFTQNDNGEFVDPHIAFTYGSTHKPSHNLLSASPLLYRCIIDIAEKVYGLDAVLQTAADEGTQTVTIESIQNNLQALLVDIGQATFVAENGLKAAIASANKNPNG